MKIGDRVYVHGYVDEIRIDTIIIRNDGGYFGTVKSEIIEAQKPEDIVSVVRCRDCKYAKKIYLKNLPWIKQWEYSCQYFNDTAVIGDGYCNNAERKDKDETD